MAVPTATNRGTPDGIIMKMGYQILITFANAPDLAIWEKNVTLPGVEIEEEIEQTTQHNVEWRTFALGILKRLTQGTKTVAWDPKAVYSDVLAVLGVEQAITCQLPNGGKLIFFGAMRAVNPQEMQRNVQPEAQVIFVPTNCDPITRAEEGPVYVPPAGT